MVNGEWHLAPINDLLLLIARPHCLQLRVSLNRISAPIHNIDFKARVRRTKPRRLPGLHCNVVFRSAMITILWQSRAIAADVSASQVKYAHSEALNAPDLPLNIRYCGHTTSLCLPDSQHH
jgi:hypothetical protein